MPYARELPSHLGDMQAVPGCSVPVKALTGAGALAVHLITRANEVLFSGRAVKFVSTATTGTDHVDQARLQQIGIGFSAAPNYNAIAAVEYVFSSLLMLTERDGPALRDRTVGVAGVDNVGGRLQKRLEVLGIRTLLYDLPRADRGGEGDFRSLDALAQEADVLTFHIPLYRRGLYKTQYLADKSLTSHLKPGTTLTNACRGPVVGDTALLKRLEAGWPLSAALDVWESEPDLDVELPKRAGIGTAYIVGYTLERKVCGTTQVLGVYNAFVGHPQQMALDTLLPAPEFDRITPHRPLGRPTLERLAHLVYDVRRDDASPRKVADTVDESDKLRKNYQERHEWPSLHVQCNDAQVATLLYQLGFNAVHHPVH